MQLLYKMESSRITYLKVNSRININFDRRLFYKILSRDKQDIGTSE